MPIPELSPPSIANWPINWEQPPSGEVLDCAIVIEPDEDGGFVVFARDLPGVVSQGETADEALEAIRDALAAAIHSYKQHQEPIPWTPSTTSAPTQTVRWIQINA